MIPRRFTKEVLDLGRRIVRGRRVNPHDALFIVHLVSRTQLQPCDAVGVDTHEVQAIGRYLDGEFLHGASIAACEQRALRPSSDNRYIAVTASVRFASIVAVATGVPNS